MKRLTVKGTWQEIGRIIGTKQKAEILSAVRRSRLNPTVKRLLPEQELFLKKNAPDQIACLYGMVDGSGVSFEKLLAIASWEYAVMDTDHCTTVLGEENGEWFVMHNEDDDPFWRGRLYQLHLEPKNGLAIDTLQYAGTLPGSSIQLNECGLVVSMDSLPSKSRRLRVGMPMSIAGALFSQCVDHDSALQTYKRMRVNAGMHFLIAQNSDWALSLEMFTDKKVARPVEPGFCHTNHAILPGSIKLKPSKSSHLRLEHTSQLPSFDEKMAEACLSKPVAEGGALSCGEAGYVTFAQTVVYPGKGEFRVREL